MGLPPGLPVMDEVLVIGWGNVNLNFRFVVFLDVSLFQQYSMALIL